MNVQESWDFSRICLSNLHCLSKRLQKGKHFCKRREQMTFVVIGALKVNLCEFSVFSS